MNPSHRISRQLCQFVLSLLFVPFSAHAAGISEPNLTIYGKVTNIADTPHQVLHVGELVWTITPPTGPAFNIPVTLDNLDGGNFSYRLEIPVEKIPSGYTLSSETIEASSTTKSYTLSVTMNGDTAVMVLPSALPHPGTTTYSEVLRGKIERIDIEVSAPPLDSDGDGMSDAFENQYASVLNANNPGDALNDPDGDGVPNIAEFLDGTDPSCFEWNKWIGSTGLTSLAGGLGAPDADPDGDGIPNLLEYAVGTDPRTADGEVFRSMVTTTRETIASKDYLTMTIIHPGTRLCNVDYIVETSSNLQTWSSASGTDVVSLSAPAGQFKIRDATWLGQPGVGQHFIRLRLVQKP